MEQEMAKGQATSIDYQSYVVKRQLEEYWRADEKVQLVLNGMHGKIPVTTLCKRNNVSPSLYYEWREKFLASCKEGLMAGPPPSAGSYSDPVTGFSTLSGAP